MYLGKIAPQRSYKWIIITVIIITVILAVAIIYLSFSKATIKIIPKKERISEEFRIQINQKEENQGLDKIAGRILTKEWEKTEKITGIKEKDIPDRAHGKIKIINNQSSPQTLVAQTRFLSESGVQFRIQRWVSIPAHGSIEEEVIADEPGEKGNIGPSKFTIPGLSTYLQQLVYGESTEPMTGGTRKATIVTEEDINNAKNKIAEELYSLALEDLKNELRGSESFDENSIKKEIIEAIPSVEANTETSEFDMKVKIKVTTPTFDREKMLKLCKSNIESKLPNNKELSSIDENSLKYSIESIDIEKKEALLKVYIEGKISVKISPDNFNKSKIIGMNKQEVEEYFKQNSEVENVEVEFWPFWIKTIPSLKDHIVIEIIH